MIGYNPSIITSGLVMCVDAASPRSYPGSGTNWYDGSGTGNNGVLQNGPTYSSTNLGSIVLDGTDDRVYVSCKANTVRTYNSSCQFVIKLPTYSGGQLCILSYRGGGAGDLYIGKSDGGIFCYYNTWAPSPGYTVGTITNGSIAVCCITLDATNNLVSTYINGSLAGSATRTGWSASYGSNFYLGYDAGGTNEYMLGNFYEFAQYDKVLTATEVLQNFNALRGRYGV